MEKQEIKGNKNVGVMSDYSVVGIIVYEREWGSKNDIQQ